MKQSQLKNEVNSLMFKKHPIFSIVSLILILGIGSVVLFPEKFFPSLFPTYLETVQTNWNLTLPTPDKTVYVLDTRGGPHGDGEAITELYYTNPNDLETIKALSPNWVDGEHFDTSKLPEDVRDLLGEVDDEAQYILFHEDLDHLILKLEEGKLTLIESFI